MRRNKVGNPLDAFFHCSRRLKGGSTSVTTRYTPNCSDLMGGPETTSSCLSFTPDFNSESIDVWVQREVGTTGVSEIAVLWYPLALAGSETPSESAPSQRPHRTTRSLQSSEPQGKGVHVRGYVEASLEGFSPFGESNESPTSCRRVTTMAAPKISRMLNRADFKVEQCRRQ